MVIFGNLNEHSGALIPGFSSYLMRNFGTTSLISLLCLVPYKIPEKNSR